MTILLTTTILCKIFSNISDPLAPEEEEETPALGEEEAMRILEQKNDDDYTDNGNTAKTAAGNEADSSMETELPQAPVTDGGAHGGDQGGGAKPTGS